MNKYLKSLVQSSGIKSSGSRNASSQQLGSGAVSKNMKADPSSTFSFGAGKRKRPIGG